MNHAQLDEARDFFNSLLETIGTMSDDPLISLPAAS